MRVFVTGASGSVGREVCRALVARGIEQRLGVRDPARATSAVASPEDAVYLDFEQEHIDPAIFAGTRSFFFMTPLLDEQVQSSKRVLEAALAGGVEHIVRLSSRSAGWDQASALRAWHREIDEAVRGSGATWTILRPCSFYQNFIRHQAATIKRMSAIILPQGNGLIPYIDTADIGQAAATCLLDPRTHGGQTYVLTGGRAYGAKGVAAEIGRVIGKPLSYISIEEDQAREMMLQAGTPEWLVEAAIAVFAHARAGAEAEVDPALSRILGRPATTLSEFVERNADAWR